MEQQDLKKIINNELSDLIVTDRLKQKTLNKIRSPKKHFHSVIRLVNLKSMSLLSSFIIVFIIGINLITPTKDKTPALKNFNNYGESIQSKDSIRASTEKSTTTTDTSDENKKG